MKLLDKFRNSSPNSKLIIKNTLGAFYVKGFSLIISVLTTPAFISYFNNNEVLGVWFTMLSVLIWFLNFDLGIGNGIRNQLVRDFANKDNDSAKCTLASGFLSTGVVTLVLTFIGILLLCFADLNSLFNVERLVLSKQTLLISSFAIFIAVMLRFFLTTVTSIFYALQKSAMNNFLALCVSILQLLYVLIFKFNDVNEALVNLSIAYVVLSNLPVIIAGIIVFIKPLKDCRPTFSAVTKTRIKSIMRIGALFFLCQILYMCIANTNEFLITNLYSASDTTQYTFYYKLMSILSMVVTLALTPVWSVVTKAVAENNFVWLSKLYKKIKLAGIAVIAVQFLIIPFMQPILDLWLGKGQVNVQLTTAISFACFSGLFVYSGMLSTIANGMAMMKVQTITFTIGVIMKFALLLLLYSITKWDFVVWTNTLVLLPYIITQQIWLNRFFKNQLKNNI